MVQSHNEIHHLKFPFKNIISFFIITVFFSKCRDAYKFQSIQSETHLVVNGSINSGPAPYYLTLGNTSLPDQIPTPIENALITISDNRGNSETYMPGGKGQYILKGSNVRGVPGLRYRLSITLQNARTYHSTQELMPVSPPTSDTTFFKITQEDVISSEGVTITNTFCNVYLDTDFPQDSSRYFRWGVEEVYLIIPLSNTRLCYIFKPKSESNFVLVKTSDYSSPHLNNLLLQRSVVDFTYSWAHFFNVTSYCMNESNYQYWTKVKGLIDRQGSVFDTPPAKVPGNITSDIDDKELVFGYFEATTIGKVVRVRVNKESIPDRALIPCYKFPFFQYCDNCDYLPGSTKDQPPWWY